MNTKLALMAAGALVAGALQVQAAQITGSIGITGTFQPNNNNLSVANTIAITFAEVDTVTGDLDLFINVDDIVAMASPYNVGANGPIPIPVGPAWDVGGFQLNLTSLAQIFENSNQLNITGAGVISGNGFDATPGDFQLNFTRSGRGATAALTFSATSAAEPVTVPDGGATAVLLGLGIFGIAAVRRQHS